VAVRADNFWVAVLLAAGLGLTLREASVDPAGSAAVPMESPAHRVDVDQATEAELRLLPGVGEILARRILEERRRGGSFGNVEELGRRVRGVGDARVRFWRTRGLVVDGATQPVGAMKGEGR
jgi:DNA uptake protein ComE-like DNA-binding protein